MLLTLAILNIILAGFDAWLTSQRMKRYGLDVELDSTTKKLAALLGKDFGPALAIYIPATVQSFLFTYLAWPAILGIFVGFRLSKFWMQLRSIQFERDLRQFKHALDTGRRSSNSGPTPPPDDQCANAPK